jgi:hypothetical protein
MVSKKSIDQLVKELEEHRVKGACLLASERSKYPAATTRVCQEIVVCIDELHQMKRRIEQLIDHEFR